MGMKDLWKSQTLQTVKTTIKFFLGAYVFLGQEIVVQSLISPPERSIVVFDLTRATQPEKPSRKRQEVHTNNAFKSYLSCQDLSSSSGSSFLYNVYVFLSCQ